MKTRFELEDEINKIYHFTDNLDMVCRAILENQLTSDEIVHALQGIKVLMSIHTDCLNDTMAQVLHLNQYQDDEDYRHNSDK